MKHAKKALLFSFSLLLFGGYIFNFYTPKASAAIPGEITYEGTVAQDYDCVGENCGLKGDDSYSTPIPIGFDFDFYGHTFSDVYLNINGVMHFGCPSSRYDNDHLAVDFDGSCDLDGDPGTTLPMAILPFWDDIITTPKDLTCTEDPLEGACDSWDWEDNYASILYKTVGDPGSRKFIAQWTNMHLYSNPNVPLGTFQVILYEGSNEFQIQYRNLLGDMERASGSSATIGIQSNYSNNTEYSFEASQPIHAEMAIRFTIGEGYSYDDEATYDPVYLSIPGAPEKPVLTAPAHNATNVVRNPTLRWNTAANADTYSLTLSTANDFSEIVAQQVDMTSTSYDITDLLEPSTTYYWNVRATNETGDIYSDTYTFTTGSTVGTPDDEDNVAPEVEDAAPNEGDGNNDGTPDSEQQNVSSVPNTVVGGSAYQTLESNGTCSAITNIEIKQEAFFGSDSTYNYPVGLTNFTLNCSAPGGSANVKVYYDKLYDTTNWKARKYIGGTFKDVAGVTFSTATVGGKQVTTMSYTLTDGGALDNDGLVNGVIVDPIGPAVLGVTTPASAPNTGFARKSIVASYAALLVGIALVYVSTKKLKVHTQASK